MPYKDPEKQRDYYSRNREKILEQQREYRQNKRDSDKEREYQREWKRRDRAASPEKYRAEARRRWIIDPKIRQRNREYQARIRANGQARVYRMKYAHGLGPDEWAALWDAQDGQCYLCGEAMDREQPQGPGQATVAVDHDHSCCPRNESCATCRRGLAHTTCNVAIGLAGDDPARLRRMADALEVAKAAVGQRKADGPAQQLMLTD